MSSFPSNAFHASSGIFGTVLIGLMPGYLHALIIRIFLFKIFLLAHRSIDKGEIFSLWLLIFPFSFLISCIITQISVGCFKLPVDCITAIVFGAIPSSFLLDVCKTRRILCSDN